jgi:hypothetical protein
MTANDLIVALDLPPDSLVDRRIAKNLLIEHGAPTAADKRRIVDGIEACRWVATLKPSTIGVPDYRDEVREYLEINVLAVTLRTGATSERLLELLHRAVPYPLVLVHDGASVGLSLSHVRQSQGEAEKTVLDGDVVATAGDIPRDDGRWLAFLGSLALRKQPRSHLHALYQAWIDVVLALHAANVTGTFTVAEGTACVVARREALRMYATLSEDITRLRTAAAKETQLARRVDLNLQLKRAEAALPAARAALA